MNDRQQRIVLLLGSLNDLLPGPAGSLRTTSGLVAAERVPCPDCGHGDTPGWRVDRFKRRARCETCNGRGRVRVDPMDADQRPVRSAVDADLPTRPPRMVVCDGCGGAGTGRPHVDVATGREWRDPCPRCNGSGRVAKPSVTDPAAEPSEQATRLEEALLRRATAGSYLELEHAIRGLPQLMRRLVFRVHVTGELRVEDLDDTDRAALGWALELLGERMPERIRVPGFAHHAARLDADRRFRVRGRMAGKDALQGRAKEIRSHRRRGRPVQWIAAEYGLSVRRVYEILAGEQEAAA